MSESLTAQFDKLVEYAVQHGQTLKNHREFGIMVAEFRAVLEEEKRRFESQLLRKNEANAKGMSASIAVAEAFSQEKRNLEEENIQLRVALGIIVNGDEDGESFSGTQCAEIARDALAARKVAR